MKIAAKNSDGSILMVGDCSGLPTTGGDITPVDPTTYTVHNVPGWDWSLADLTGVDRTKPDWLNQVKWNGTTIVKK